jgi:hypothetical protein
MYVKLLSFESCYTSIFKSTTRVSSSREKKQREGVRGDMVEYRSYISLVLLERRWKGATNLEWRG